MTGQKYRYTGSTWNRQGVVVTHGDIVSDVTEAEYNAFGDCLASLDTVPELDEQMTDSSDASNGSDSSVSDSDTDGGDTSNEDETDASGDDSDDSDVADDDDEFVLTNKDGEPLCGEIRKKDGDVCTETVPCRWHG